MINLKKILLPTDFSDYAAEAMKYACEFADRFQAQLYLLHVLEIHADPTPQFGMGLALPSHVEESTKAADQHLATLIDPSWTTNHSVVRTTVHGTPFVEIVRYARQQDIDLIVMGTHGRSGLAHVLTGSVAERVVRKAPCPVLTVRPEGHQFVMP